MEIQQIDGLVGNSNFKSTELGEFFMDFENCYIFEEEIIPSRAWNAGIIVFYSDKRRNL